MKIKITVSIISIFLLSSCFNTEPKVLGELSSANISPANTSNLSNFRVSFAYSASSPAASGDFVFLQGAPGTGAALTSTCNSSGTACVCDFYNAGNTLVSSTSTTDITYDVKGNFLICRIPSGAAVTSVALRNQSSTQTISATTITTTPTLAQMLGSLGVAKVRKVSYYKCQIKYIQKSDYAYCNSTGGAISLNLIRMDYTFYLWSDSTQNNYTQKATDYVYGMPTGQWCGTQIKQINCYDDGAGSTTGYAAPVLDFGIFAEQGGIFTLPVQLTSGTSVTNGQIGTYGFAAPLNNTLGTPLCPPGMVRKQFFTATPTTSGTIYNNAMGDCAGCLTNVSSITDTLVKDITYSGSLAVKRYTGGSCAAGNTTCTAPDQTVVPASYVTSAVDTALTYVAATGAGVCVIPASIITTAGI